MKKIRWINTNTTGHRDDAGNWRSVEGRFEISPKYRHTVYPDSYEIEDVLQQARNHSPNYTVKIAKQSFDTVRECKQWADDIVVAELMRNT